MGILTKIAPRLIVLCMFYGTTLHATNGIKLPHEVGSKPPTVWKTFTADL